MRGLDESINLLSEAADNLNRKTDNLNQTIRSVEERIQSAGVGLTCWLDQPEHHISPDQWESKKGLGDCSFPLEYFRSAWIIGYTKADSRWCLVVRRVEAHEEWTRDGDSESCSRSFLEPIGDQIPLLKAPRHLRVEATKRLGPLVSALTERVNSFVESVERANQIALKATAGTT
jgi:hypothetical protein